MTDPDSKAAMRARAERLGFVVGDGVLEECLQTAQKLKGRISSLKRDTDGSVVPVDVTASGPHDEFLARHEKPRRTTEEGPLAGTTVAVKDNILTSDLQTTCGADLVGLSADADATVVERLLDAGAGLLGKTNMDTLAFGPSGEFTDFGRVTNPVDADRVPGGSSSGSGAAVASGAVDVALGTDTGGSVRIPAACCGVVGAKPTHGLVPRTGFVSFAPSLDTIGPLARSVGDAAMSLAAIAGPESGASTGPAHDLGPYAEWSDATAPLTVGLPAEFFDRTTDPVAGAVRDAVARASALDAEPVDLDLGAVEQAYFVIGAAEFTWLLEQSGAVRGEGPDYTDVVRRAMAALRQEGLGDHIARRLLPAAYLDATTDGGAYVAARRERTAFVRRLEAALEPVDALVTPTIRTLPPERGRMESVDDMLTLLGNTAPFNLAGTPAVSVPVDTHDGLPVSAQVVAPRFADPLATVAAERLERASAA